MIINICKVQSRLIILSNRMLIASVWKKYLVRVVKIVTLVILCHEVLNAKLLEKQSKDNQLFLIINNILCISAGTFNTYLLHSNLKGEDQKKWLYFNFLKLASGLIVFTPILTLLPVSNQNRTDIRFYWMVSALLLSPLARYFREYSVAKQQTKEKRSKE